MSSNCEVVRIRPLGTDDNGDPIEGDPDELALMGCMAAPRSSENIDARGRGGVVVGLSLFTPYAADVVHGDLFRITGLGPSDGLYKLEGEAGAWKGLSGWEAGTEIALERAAG